MTDHYHPNFPPHLAITPNDEAAGNAFGVEAQREAISTYGIAGRVWEAAHALCTYVESDALDFDPPFAEGPDGLLGVIELGSGTGIVAASIANAIRRAEVQHGIVVATDLPDVCPLLTHNLGAYAQAAVRPLAWGHLDHVTTLAREFGFDATHQLTHILCSDLVYFPELFGPLLRTLIWLTSLPSVPKVVMSYKIRSVQKETSFWMAFGLWFSFWPVLVRRREDASGPWRQFGADSDSDRTFVFVACRRLESMAWHVPEVDTELMAGIGARGTSTTKNDDTFETILFMMAME